MDIKNRLYPHPVLGAADDFVNSTFQFDMSVEREFREILLRFSMDLKNSDMLRMIQEDGTAEFLVHVECPTTCYRTIVTEKQRQFTAKFPERSLKGKVSVCVFVVAGEDLPYYSNPDFNADYSGTSFEVRRGGILAVGGQRNLNIQKDAEELGKIQSVITISRYGGDNAPMTVDISGDKIVVGLAGADFQNYRMLTAMPGMLPVSHAMIILPALIHALDTLRREGTEEYEGLRWYASVRKALERGNMVLNAELLENESSCVLAQKLLDMPLSRALKAVTDAGGEEEG